MKENSLTKQTRCTEIYMVFPKEGTQKKTKTEQNKY